jgi:hypothetical protein
MTESIVSEFDNAAHTLEQTVVQNADKVEDVVETKAETVVAESESELQKVENAALNVVHQIEEKMGIVEQAAVTEAKAIEGHLVEGVKKAIHFVLPAGGGSIIKNPG